MINHSALTIGLEYNRPTLAKLWGYKSFNAISRGVFSPKNEKMLVFFITKEKQESLTQYIDHIDTDILFWEGEKGHGNDERIISRQDTILIFYRDRHHSDFIYEGRAALRGYCLFNDRPSKFTFDLIDKKVAIKDMVAEIRQDYGIPETEKLALINSRRGQGLYRNRAIDLWKSCSVTGFTESTVLIASHIKPWKVSTNDERLNPFNSLLLVPTLDKLFDNGYISFEQNGSIMLSSKINQLDWDRIGVSTKMQLRGVPVDSKSFLEYHREYVYDLGTERDEV